MTSQFNQFQQIKRRFFAMRNGVIADTLRKAGSPYKIIFGLNLPQLVEIAQSLGYDAELARRLRENASTRESQLLAPMVFPPEQLTDDEAILWIEESASTEAVDMICHRLLRNLDRSLQLAEVLALRYEPLSRYASMRLIWHYIPSSPAKVRALAEAEAAKSNPLTLPLTAQIISELDFMAQDAKGQASGV